MFTTFIQSATAALAIAAASSGVDASAAATTNTLAPDSAPTGAITGKLTAEKERGEAVWVVYIVDLSAKKADRDFAKRGEYRIDQKNTRFEPKVLIVPVHAEVEFPNSDKFFHNVFSMSEPNIFDLGLYRGGDSRSVEMRKAGEVDVFCNIHPMMHMKIFVVPNRFFAEAGKDGKFRIEGVPPGAHELGAWSSHHEPLTAKVTVTAGGTVTTKLHFAKERPWNMRHLHKDGSHYGRYE